MLSGEIMIENVEWCEFLNKVSIYVWFRLLGLRDYVIERESGKR